MLKEKRLKNIPVFIAGLMFCLYGLMVLYCAFIPFLKDMGLGEHLLVTTALLILAVRSTRKLNRKGWSERTAILWMLSFAAAFVWMSPMLIFALFHGGISWFAIPMFLVLWIPFATGFLYLFEAVTLAQRAPEIIGPGSEQIP